MLIIYAREVPPPRPYASIFLMGPTPRSDQMQSWRPTALSLLESSGFDGVVFVPEDRPDPDGVSRFKGDYVDQVEWEEFCLNLADVILAWVPRNMETLPGLTTNVEWGVWYDSGKVVLGSPPDAEKNRYLEHYAQKMGVPLSSQLKQTVADALSLLGERPVYDANCVFCRIVTCDPKGQIEREWADSVLITPLGPVTPGHKLVIPRRHVKNAREYPDITARTMRDAAHYVAETHVGDCNIITSIGSDATQTVFHLHVHIVPRRHDDGLHLPWTGQKH